MAARPDAAEISDFITGWLTAQLGQSVLPEANFGALGMDSLDAVTLIDALADKLEMDDLAVSLVLDYPTAQSLAEHLSQL